MIEKKHIIRSLSLFLIGGLCLGLISGCQPGSTGNTGLPAGSDSADGSEEESFSDPNQGEMKEPDGTDTETQESVTSSVMSDNELLIEAVKQLVTREYWVTTDGTKKCCILLENPVKVDITVDFTVKYCDPEENVLGEEKFTVDIPACGKRFVELTKTFSEEEIFADLYFDLDRCRRVKPLQSEFDCEAEASEGAVVSFIIGNHSEYTAENLSVYFVFWKENTPVSRVP